MVRLHCGIRKSQLLCNKTIMRCLIILKLQMAHEWSAGKVDARGLSKGEPPAPLSSIFFKFQHMLSVLTCYFYKLHMMYKEF
jgi:hypothetical protein